MKKYFLYSVSINLKDGSKEFTTDLSDKTPIEYLLYWKKLGGDYFNRTILFKEEISEKEFEEYKHLF